MNLSRLTPCFLARPGGRDTRHAFQGRSDRYSAAEGEGVWRILEKRSKPGGSLAALSGGARFKERAKGASGCATHCGS